MAKISTITKEGMLQPIAVENHGVSPEVKADIDGLKAKVTTIEGDVTNLSSTSTDISTKVDGLEENKADKSWVEEQDYATNTDVDAVSDRVASLESIDHSKYLTEHQDISNLATKSEVTTVDNKVDAVQDLVEAIKIPTKVSELENDKNFQTKTDVETIAETKAADKVAEIVNGAPEDFDTLKEIAEALADNEDAVAGIVTTLGTKADKETTYTKTEVDNKLSTAATAVSNTYETKENATATYATKTAIADMLTKTVAADTYQPKGNYLTQHQSLADYAKTADVNTELAKKVDKVNGKSLVSDSEITKLSALPSKTELDASLADKLNVTTHNTDKATLEASIATKANSADVYTKTVADETFETIANHDADKAEINASIALCETKENHKKDYDAIMSRLNDIAQTYSLYGMARVNGESSPAGTKFFGEESNLKQIAGICHIGLVDGNGKLYKRCANGRIDLSSDGTDLYIDGSDGDVMVYIDRSIYVSKFTDTLTIEKDGETTTKEMNIFALGLAPFSIEGHPAKEIKAFAFSPQYTVNCKLDASNTAKENGSDKRSCAHSIYNENIAGSFASPVNSFKNNTFKPNGKKYPSQNVNSMQSIWHGQCKNEVETTNRPFMGGYYEFTEIWLMLMFLENGSLYHQALDDFGVGSTMSNVVSASNFCTDTMSANSGVKLVKEDKTASYVGLMSQNTLNGNNYPLASLVGTNYYGFTEMLETQRLLNDIAKAGLVNKIWKQKGDDENKSIIFEYNEDGKIVVSEKTVTDIVNGNITAGKKYYQVRNAKKCIGMEEGIMTAVTNTFIRFDFIDGVKCSNVEYTNGYAIYKFSRAIYRGMSLSFEGMFTQMQGCHFVRVHPTKLWNTETQAFDGENNENQTIYSYFKCAENVDDCPALASSSVDYFGDEDEETVMERGLTKSVLSSAMVCNGQYVGPQGWITKADYNLSLFCPTAFSGGALSTHECAYLWNYGSWQNGDAGTINSNGTPKKGRKCVNAVVVGCYAGVSNASARTVHGSHAVSHSDDDCAGRFSLPYLTF